MDSAGFATSSRLEALIGVDEDFAQAKARLQLLAGDGGCDNTATFQKKVDYQGGDISNGKVSGGATDAKACCLACFANTDCKFWTWGTDNNKCWLKNSDKGKQSQNNRESGGVDRTTAAPTAPPTSAPTRQPSVAPTVVPSALPSLLPTVVPSNKPTSQPTDEPTAAPTNELTTALTGDTLQQDIWMMPGQQLTSSNGEYEFIMQGDGNAVLYIKASKKAIWNSGTAGQPGNQLRMQVCVAHTCHGRIRAHVCATQGDGNIVIYGSDGKSVKKSWNTNGKGKAPYRLVMQVSTLSILLRFSDRSVLATSLTHACCRAMEILLPTGPPATSGQVTLYSPRRLRRTSRRTRLLP